MIRLAIWASGRRLGVLSHDTASHLFDFAYDKTWIASPSAFPLSPQMPLSAGVRSREASAFAALAPEQRSAIARGFFQNLMPEGQALDVAAQANGLSKGNLAGLLLALGTETAGALSVTLADADAEADADTDADASKARNGSEPRRPLTLKELGARIRNRSQMPFSVWDGKVRLSIAGLQDKIAVFESDGRLYLANGGEHASTVIVKPAPVDPRFAELPAIEHVCMRLSDAAGIPTARTRLVHVPEPVLLVDRFDRRQSAEGAVERLHIIDACQALGLTPELKYERAYGDQDAVRHLRDGASLEQLFRLAQTSRSPVLMRSQLLDRLVFNVLLGNTDAHGKNWSFFIERHEGTLSLAPAYDLVDVEGVAVQHMSTSFAMGIGEAFELDDLTPFEWASLAQRCEIAPKLMSRRIADLCDRLPRVLASLRPSLVQDGVAPDVIDGMAERLSRRCAAVAPQAPEIPKVPVDLL